MTARRLDRAVTAYRIGDPAGRFPIFDATGSRIRAGRWNTRATPMIYASEHYATAMLETLAGASGILPPNQFWIEITIDAGIAHEVFSAAHHPGWDAPSRRVSRAYGETWRREARSAILIVPSYVARIERNVLINPDHPDFPRIRPSLAQPVWWDGRLFS